MKQDKSSKKVVINSFLTIFAILVLFWAGVCSATYFRTVKALENQGVVKEAEVVSIKAKYNLIINMPTGQVVFADDPQHTYQYYYNLSDIFKGTVMPQVIGVYEGKNQLEFPEKDPTVTHPCGRYPYTIPADKLGNQ